MKTMTIEELRERGLKVGDIYRADFDLSTTEYDGWYLVLEGMAVGLDTKNPKAWRLDSSFDCIDKIILSESVKNSLPDGISKFLKTFDESLVGSLIIHIRPKISKYLHAVHFGSTRLYTWRVPQKLEKVNFKIGDIVEVETMYGNQYVQVKETAQYEYDEKTKEVISLIKAIDLPF